MNTKELKVSFGYKIVNGEVFFENVESLNMNLHEGSTNGDVEINGNCITGEHGTCDYVEDYGFEIVEQEYIILDASNNAPELRYVADTGTTGDRQTARRFDINGIIEFFEKDIDNVTQWGMFEEFYDKSY